MAIYRGQPSVIYIFFSLLIVLPLFAIIASIILLVERKNLHPLKSRNMPLLFFLSIVSVVFSWVMLFEWFPFFADVPCIWTLIVEGGMIVLLLHIYTFRILFLWISHREQNKILLKQKEKGNKTIFSIQNLKRVEIIIPQFIGSYLLVVLPMFIPIIWDYDSFFQPLKVCNNINPEIFYLYAVIGCYNIVIFIFGYKIGKKQDAFYFKQEFILCGISITFGLVFYLIFVYLEVNQDFPCSALFPAITGYFLFGFSIIFPIIKSFETQNILKNKLKDTASPIQRLQLLLEKEDKINKFREHLMTEFSVENLEFYEAYKHLKEKEDVLEQKSIMNSVEYIYDKFIKKDADYQVNISESQRKNVEQEIEQGNYNSKIFEQAIHEVLDMLAKDSLPRYEYKENKE